MLPQKTDNLLRGIVMMSRLRRLRFPRKTDQPQPQQKDLRADLQFVAEIGLPEQAVDLLQLFQDRALSRNIVI